MTPNTLSLFFSRRAGTKWCVALIALEMLLVNATASAAGISYPGSNDSGVVGLSGDVVVGNEESLSDVIGNSEVNNGFLYDASTGAYNLVSYPPSDVYTGGFTGTDLTGISGNYVVGSYVDTSRSAHGLLYNDVTGVFTVLDQPGSVSSYVEAISGDNVLTFGSTSVDFDSAMFSLYNIASQTWSAPFNPPGDLQYGLSFKEYMSGSYIAGDYYNAALGVEAGFVWNLASGTYTTLVDPFAPTTPETPQAGTFVTGISGNTAVGYYTDINGNINAGSDPYFSYNVNTGVFTPLAFYPITIDGNNVLERDSSGAMTLHVNAVPEPSSFVLIVLCMSAFYFHAQRHVRSR